jgi:hypothetical protein
VKPISYLKAHAPEIARESAAGGEPLAVTVHGEAKATSSSSAPRASIHGRPWTM